MIKQDVDRERVEAGAYYFGAHYDGKQWNEYEAWLFQEGLTPVRYVTREELEKLYPKRRQEND